MCDSDGAAGTRRARQLLGMVGPAPTRSHEPAASQQSGVITGAAE